MPDRNHQNETNPASDNLNAKEPGEIDKAPKQDIEKVNLESQKDSKGDEAPSTETEPLEQQ